MTEIPPFKNQINIYSIYGYLLGISYLYLLWFHFVVYFHFESDLRVTSATLLNISLYSWSN